MHQRDNYQPNHARAMVEHAHGRLKGRYHCLLKRLDVNERDVPELVAACCVLHKMCEVHSDTLTRVGWKVLTGADKDILKVGLEKNNLHA